MQQQERPPAFSRMSAADFNERLIRAPGGSGLAIELKAGKGTLTDDQREYREAAGANGCVTGVCFTLDQFITLVRRYVGVSH